MRALIGLCLLTTGLAIGAYSHYPGAQHREASLAELTQIVTGALPSQTELSTQHTNAYHSEPGESATLRYGEPLPAAGPLQQTSWFAPPQSIAAFETLTGPTPVIAHEAARPLPPRMAAGQDGSHQRVAQRSALQGKAKPRMQRKPILRGWRTAVVAVDHANTIAPKPSSSLKPKTAAERWRLAKAIQRELKRVGCYWGKLDGVWGKGSKWAMADFMRSVNATLPTKNPDYFLLQLVSSHGPDTCGAGRANTQIASRRHKPKTPPAQQSSWVAEVIATSPTKVDNIAPRRIARARPTAKPQIKTGRLQPAAQAKPHQVAAIKRRPKVLPGRMSIGALNRDSTPQLVAPPRRLRPHERMMVREETNTKPKRQAERRLRLSAIPRQTKTDATPPRIRQNPEANAGHTNGSVNAAPPVRRVSPSVAERRSSAKAKRARALRKAAAKKKKRKRYRRRYRGRSLQSMFMHPLGRR